MINKSIEIGGRQLTIESGKIAKQAGGSCIIRYGETVIFVAVTSSKGVEEDRGFFPMSETIERNFMHQEGFLVVSLRERPDHLNVRYWPLD